MPNTGWTIIKPNADWELIFKWKSCPNHLPAHCHSDLLSFDLIKKENLFFQSLGQVFMEIMN